MLNKNEKQVAQAALDSVEYALEKVNLYLPGPAKRSTIAHLRSARVDLEVLRDGHLVKGLDS
ncbi:hypothetical protein SEA_WILLIAMBOONE_161 [Gordonia phage WilliamBoone]|nr:hypothetical protein SEA_WILLIAMBOONE_161 [Gordonia phage WilliamBoone]